MRLNTGSGSWKMIDPAETEIICPTVGEKLDKAPEA